MFLNMYKYVSDVLFQVISLRKGNQRYKDTLNANFNMLTVSTDLAIDGACFNEISKCSHIFLFKNLFLFLERPPRAQNLKKTIRALDFCLHQTQKW